VDDAAHGFSGERTGDSSEHGVMRLRAAAVVALTRMRWKVFEDDATTPRCLLATGPAMPRLAATTAASAMCAGDIHLWRHWAHRPDACEAQEKVRQRRPQDNMVYLSFFFSLRSCLVS